MVSKEAWNDMRMDLIKKLDKNFQYKPTDKEMEEAYGYLSYCNDCGKALMFGEPWNHGFCGNWHKFGCSKAQRTFGYFYSLLMFTIKLPLFLFIIPFYWIYKKIKGEKIDW